MKTRFKPEVRRALVIMTVLRLLGNSGSRMAYTFLPQFSTGTGVSVSSLGQVIAARDLSSVLGPWVAKLTNKIGLRSMVFYSGLISMLALLLASTGTTGFLIGTLIYGVVRTGYHIAGNAWLGAEVPYERRAKASGLVELSWGGSFLIVLPLLGLAIKYIGWQAAPGLLGLAMLPLVLATKNLEAVSDERSTNTKATKVTYNHLTVSTLASHAFLMASAQCLVLTHGLWLSDVYDLDAAAIGFTVLFIGALEVLATLFSSGFTDWFGKRNSIVGGSVVMLFGMAALMLFPAPPFLQGLAMLIIAFLGFEFGIVSSIPLIAELDPNNRAGIFGVAVAVAQIARGVITLVAAWMYEATQFGFPWVMGMAIILGVVSTGIAITQIREP